MDWGSEIRQRHEEALKLRIAAVIAARTGDYPIRPKRPPRQIHFPASEPQPKRGVYELEFAPEGRRAFHMVSSNGEVAYIDMPAHWVTRDFIRNLWRRLDREDPLKPSLQLIHRDE